MSGPTIVYGPAISSAPVVITAGAPVISGGGGTSILAASNVVYGGGPTVAAAGAGAVAGPASTAAGGSANDTDLVNRALNFLSSSQLGAFEVQRLQAAGAKIEVLSGAEFAAEGESGAHAFYDPNTRKLYLRREDLQNDLRLSAVEIAHEGTHLLDDYAGVTVAFQQQQLAQINRLSGTARTEAVRQLQFQLMMIDETRAFTFSGQIARDLGWATVAADPTYTAIRGNNDVATYSAVWQAILGSAYNDEHRTSQVIAL